MIHRWDFPLTSINDGLCLGNGRFGARVWGEDRVLKITFGRADFWDRRGGVSFREGMTYARIRDLLEAGDQDSLRRLFAQPEPEPGQPMRPTVMPVGRIELHAPEGDAWAGAELEFDTARVRVSSSTGRMVEICLDREQPVLAVWSDQWGDLAVHLRPSWDLMRDRLEAVSLSEPVRFETGGWFQGLPEDDGVCVTAEKGERNVRIAVSLGRDSESARASASGALETTPAEPEAFAKRAEAGWRAYWDSLPRVEIPNERLAFQLRYGLFRLGGLTAPDGVAPTLQGPWIEDEDFPAWSSDYHWNINVQMCCWPMFPAGQADRFRPLIRMLESWVPLLRENARLFAGCRDGRLLPHATDDTGRAMGGFWTGLIDHGCTTWIATLFFTYWRHTGDVDFLRETALPLMRGTFEVWRAMLEEDSDGWLHLPVSVSPEYKGSRPDAWGADASFQLAAIHRLVRDLQNAAKELGEPADPFWEKVEHNLPRATLAEWPGPETAIVGPPGYRPIALWHDQLLEESHRHHSHLAGVHPFDTLDLDDPEWLRIVDDTFKQMTFQGMGLWAGWSLPWAAILHARTGGGATAEWLLEIWERVFYTPGHGQTHDAPEPGFTLMGNASIGLVDASPRPERMQMDQPMGAVTAIFEMLLHERAGVIRVFAGIPRTWQDVAFRGIHCPGGLVVDAVRRNGRTTRVTVHAVRTTTCLLANPWTGGEILEIPLQAGETRTLCPPD